MACIQHLMRDTLYFPSSRKRNNGRTMFVEKKQIHTKLSWLFYCHSYLIIIIIIIQLLKLNVFYFEIASGLNGDTLQVWITASHRQSGRSMQSKEKSFITILTEWIRDILPYWLLAAMRARDMAFDLSKNKWSNTEWYIEQIYISKTFYTTIQRHVPLISNHVNTNINNNNNRCDNKFRTLPVWLLNDDLILENWPIPNEP